jgi:hypothetical protein
MDNQQAAQMIEDYNRELERARVLIAGAIRRNVGNQSANIASQIEQAMGEIATLALSKMVNGDNQTVALAYAIRAYGLRLQADATQQVNSDQ